MLFDETFSKCFELSNDIPKAIQYEDFWVYHYTSPDGFMNIIQNNGKAKLWFTQYDSLNDVNERKAFEEFFKEYCEQKKKKKAFPAAFISSVASMSGSDVCGITRWTDERLLLEDGTESPVVHARQAECDTYLCCFSSDPDSLAMWNYYSKTGHYEGYNICLVADSLESNSGFGKGYSLRLVKVVYDDDEKEKILDQLLVPLAELFSKEDDQGRKSILRSVQSAVDNLQFSFKNQCFAHEKEVRAILRVPRVNKDNEKIFERKYRQKNGFIIPYIEFPLRSGVVRGVTMAPLICEDVALKNAQAFLESRGHAVKVMASQIPIRF